MAELFTMSALPMSRVLDTAATASQSDRKSQRFAIAIFGALSKGSDGKPMARGPWGQQDTKEYLKFRVVRDPKNLFGIFLTSKGHFNFSGYFK